MRVLVDAEYTYLNPGISAVALALMRLYNAKDNSRPLVANTYQCYLRVSYMAITLLSQLTGMLINDH